jgi:hypothetical protein
MTDTETPKPSGPVKKKFFQKPAWLLKQSQSASRDGTDEGKTKDATELFSRSVDSHEDIVAEQEHREQLKAERKKVKATQEVIAEKSTKRRRISTEEEDGAIGGSDRKK